MVSFAINYISSQHPVKQIALMSIS